MYLFAVDPAASKPSTYALILDESVIDFGEMPENAIELLGFYNQIALNCNEQKIYFAIEDQYNDKSWRELKRLAAARGRIVGIAELVQEFVILDPVNPSSWQTAVFRSRRPPRRSKMRDQLLIQYAEQFIAPGAGRTAGKFNIDHAAAIHIGLYSARRVAIDKA